MDNYNEFYQSLLTSEKETEYSLVALENVNKITSPK